MDTKVWSAMIVLGAIFAPIALIHFAVGLSRRREAQRLLASGLEAEAEILEYPVGKGLWVRYQFTPVGATAPIVCTKSLMTDVKKLPVGAKVPVRYKAGIPSVSVLVPYASSQMPS